MKRTLCVVTNRVPRDSQESQDGSAKGAIWGANVYNAGWFNALLRYSTYDSILIATPDRSDDYLTQCTSSAATESRVSFLNEIQLANMAAEERLVFATTGPFISDLDRLRKRMQRLSAPVTGVIHANNSSFALHAILLAAIGDIQSYDAIVCTSDAGRQTIVNCFQELQQRIAKVGLTGYKMTFPKTPVIPIGVNTGLFTQDDRDGARQMLEITSGVVLLYFGRFDLAGKADVFPLIAAFETVLRTEPNAWLVLAGDDTAYHLEPKVTKFADELGIGSRVRVVVNPSFNRKRQLYAAADIFVSLPDNLQETFGITVVEAMASGLPVIGADWDGYKDTIISDETGILIPTLLPRFEPPFDPILGPITGPGPDLLACSTVSDLRALVRAIIDLVRQPELRKRLGAAGRLRARAHFDWSIIVKQYEALWDASSEEGHLNAIQSDVGTLGLTRYDYLRLFSHYATTMIDSTVCLRVSDVTHDSKYMTTLSRFIAPNMSWFQQSEFDKIITFINAKETVSIGEIVEGLTSCNIDHNIILSHVARLWKYGLLESLPKPEVHPS